MFSLLKIFFPILWLVQFFPSPGPGSIGSHGLSCAPSCVTFDAAIISASYTGTSGSWTHTVASQSNLLLLVWTENNQGDRVTGVTYNSVVMTKIASAVSAAPFVQLWCLVAPSTGANSVTVTQTSDNFSQGGSISLYNAKQSCTLDNSSAYHVVASGGPTTLNQSITPVTTNVLVVDGNFLSAATVSISSSLAHSATSTNHTTGVASTDAFLSGSKTSGWTIGNTNQPDTGVIASVATGP